MSDKIVKYRLFDSAVLNATGTLTTDPLDVRSAKVVQAVRVKATSASAQGSVDFSIKMAVSDYGPRANKPDFVTAPVEDYDNFNITILDHWNLTDHPADWQVIPMPPSFAPWMKLLFSGLGANPVDTQIIAKLIMMESL